MLARARAFAVGLALTLAVGFAWSQQSSIGGFPSRPILQTVNATSTYAGGTGSTTAFVARSGYPSLELRESDASANNVRWRIGASGEQFFLDALADNGASGGTVLTVERTGTTIDLVNLQGTVVQVNGVVAATQTTGTFSATWTNACTTTPTTSFTYVKTGVMVTLQMTSFLTCTSDSTNTEMDVGQLPVEIRPISTVCVGLIGSANSGTSGPAALQIGASGGLVISYDAGEACGVMGTWTASGVKAVNKFSVSYPLI